MLLSEESSTTTWQRDLAKAISIGVGTALYRLVADVARAIDALPGEGKLNPRALGGAIAEALDRDVEYYEDLLRVDVSGDLVDAILKQAAIPHLSSDWVSAAEVRLIYAPPGVEPTQITAPIEGMTPESLRLLLGILHPGEAG